MRRRALREDTLTLSRLLDMGLSFETSEAQALGIEKEEPPAQSDQDVWQFQACKTQGQTINNHRLKGIPPQRPVGKSPSCRNCGGSWPHAEGQSSCPAKNKTCRYCKKVGHYEDVCLSKRGRQPSKRGMSWRGTTKRIAFVEEDSSDSEDEQIVAPVRQGSTRMPKVPEVDLSIDTFLARVTLDTGASINILDHETYIRSGSRWTLKKTSVKIFPVRQ